MAGPLCPGQHFPETSHELWPSPDSLGFSTRVLFLPCGLSCQSRAGETHQGNGRAVHISKLSSWGQQLLHLLQNRNMVLVTFKFYFLHPYRSSMSRAEHFPRQVTQLFAWRNLTLPQTAQPCGSLAVLAPAPWLLPLSREWGHCGGRWEERFHHSNKAHLKYCIVHLAKCRYWSSPSDCGIFAALAKRHTVGSLVNLHCSVQRWQMAQECTCWFLDLTHSQGRVHSTQCYCAAAVGGPGAVCSSGFLNFVFVLQRFIWMLTKVPGDMGMCFRQMLYEV